MYDSSLPLHVSTCFGHLQTEYIHTENSLLNWYVDIYLTLRWIHSQLGVWLWVLISAATGVVDGVAQYIQPLQEILRRMSCSPRPRCEPRNNPFCALSPSH